MERQFWKWCSGTTESLRQFKYACLLWKSFWNGQIYWRPKKDKESKNERRGVTSFRERDFRVFNDRHNLNFVIFFHKRKSSTVCRSGTVLSAVFIRASGQVQIWTAIWILPAKNISIRVYLRVPTRLLIRICACVQESRNGTSISKNKYGI